MYLKAYANHLPGVQVMETISLQCNGLSHIHSSVYFRLKIVRQVEHTLEKCWHKFGWNPLRNEWVIQHTSECTKREFEKILLGFMGAPASPRKSVRWKWKKQTNKQRRRKKTTGAKNVFVGRKEFIRLMQKARVINIKRLQLNNFWYIEGTICLVNGWMGMVFWAWAHERAPLNSQWLVLRIGGADFLHC